LLNQGGDDHGVAKVSINFILLHQKAVDDDTPSHHSESTIRKLLDVEVANVWMKLSSPKEVKNNVST
jgi:hypothetical protein